MDSVEILVALAIAIGLAGVLVPALPGSLLVGAAILCWGLHVSTGTGWIVVVLALALLVVGAVVKYVVPGRRLRDAGVPPATMLAGAVLGVVGFFVIPVIGLALGFLLGVFLMQWHHLGRERAWPATWAAIKAIGLGMLIELTCASAAAIVWAVGLLVTS